MAKKKRSPRRRKVAAGSVGLTPDEVGKAGSRELDGLSSAVEADGGAVLARYSEPFGGKPVLLVALPLASVEPTPYQRDPSDAHVKRLMAVVEKIGLFLDPIIAIRHEDKYWTPNGNHRLQALRKLGVRTVVALLLPDPQVAFKILALNTEKAHNLKEKSLETIRMARALAGSRSSSGEPERSFEFEFELPSFLTLGAAYEERPRLSGSAYQPILRRVDDFLDEPIGKAMKERERRAKKILKLDDAVSAIVDRLKAKRLTSPYLKPFVVARVNYTRFSKATSFDFDEALDRILASALKFNTDRISQQDIVRAGGASADDES
jgi:ParB family chromosome partitioning protein